MVLLKFMRFQQLFKIEELDIYKENLRNDESIGKWGHWTLQTIIVTLMTSTFLLQKTESSNDLGLYQYYASIYSMVQFGILMIELNLYF